VCSFKPTDQIIKRIDHVILLRVPLPKSIRQTIHRKVKIHIAKIRNRLPRTIHILILLASLVRFDYLVKSRLETVIADPCQHIPYIDHYGVFHRDRIFKNSVIRFFYLEPPLVVLLQYSDKPIVAMGSRPNVKRVPLSRFDLFFLHREIMQ
jgi:hypothetical protein